jgi:DNA-binding transcriptional MerR regulator
MPAKDTFTIGELAARVGVTPDARRYYERLGLVARVPRTTGGFRVYPADCQEITAVTRSRATSVLTQHPDAKVQVIAA